MISTWPLLDTIHMCLITLITNCFDKTTVNREHNWVHTHLISTKYGLVMFTCTLDLQMMIWSKTHFLDQMTSQCISTTNMCPGKFVWKTKWKCKPINCSLFLLETSCIQVPHRIINWWYIDTEGTDNIFWCYLEYTMGSIYSDQSPLNEYISGLNWNMIFVKIYLSMIRPIIQSTLYQFSVNLLLYLCV